MKKISIVHILGAINSGGAERFVVDLCNQLAKNNLYQVNLICLCKNNIEDTIINEISPNVNYISFNKNSGFSLLTLIKLTYWLIRNKPIIVHTHLNSFEYLYGYLLINSRSKFFHTLHNMAQYECPNFFIIKYLRTFFYKQNKVKAITISKNGSETYQQYHHLNNDTIIANGRPHMQLTSKCNELIKKYKNNSESFLLLHIGRLSEEKNQRLLILAVQKFNQLEHRKCKLLMIGIGNELLGNELKQLAKADNHIEFLGLKRNIADYLSIADAFCLSSNFEGMPIVIIEALSMGCIPISTAVGGVPQMISHGKTGFLSKDLSVDSYCHTLKQALLSLDKEQIIKNCTEEFKNKYHIKIAANDYLKAYALSLGIETAQIIPQSAQLEFESI
ncbi:MAG: glycosyltransferase [Flavobacterium sp.]|nr:MAG: glycosyltransferase [Flavobacterium sp.]